MSIVLLKNLTDKLNILEQQNFILSYAKKHLISIQSIEIDLSDSSKILEDRLEFRAFLRSLKPNSNLLVYDFWVLSFKVDELVKICECLLQRDICLHICNQKKSINSSSSPLYILNILAEQRHKLHNKQNLSIGRPKGRMSKSKFDQFRTQIISYLEQGYSVSGIASILKISRTSLKDYINSRNLKDLANTKKELLGATPKKNTKPIMKPKKCELIDLKELKAKK